MIKKLICFALLLILLKFTPISYAFEPFIKYEISPLPFTNNFPNWNEAGQYQPSTIFENGIFKMWYASWTGSHFKIIYADSIDGISWTRRNLFDLLPGYDTTDPAILKTLAGYKLFFVGSTNNGSQNFKIYKIDSTDGINFDPLSRRLVLEAANSMESVGNSSPSVIFENGNYFLYYLCWGDQGFRICLATSTDGDNWQRCPNNPIIREHSDGPYIFNQDGKHYLFFQSPVGFRSAETTENLSCTTNWTNFQTFYPEGGISPDVIKVQDALYLYYSAITLGNYKIYLAKSGSQSPLTGTPTPSLTPTQTLTPTPTSFLRKRKIVIIPGMFASWNKDALLHNSNTSVNNWELLNFVSEYEGLTKTLENLNYKKDEDYFLFTYDWRKNLDNITQDLNLYLNDKSLLENRVSFVGHSLGGLVARIYGQKYGTNNLNKIITLGSPHSGTALIYKVVEAGEIEREDTLMWLMQKLILMLNRKRFTTLKQTVDTVIPVARDLFPIYDFLIDDDEESIPIRSMKIKNLTLLNYSDSFPQLFSSLITFAGNKGNTTLSGYNINKPSIINQLLNQYPDGQPNKRIYSTGDNVITLSSALAGNDLTNLSADHGEIIYKAEGIKKILDKLNIPYSPNQIAEGQATKITPSLIFTLLSPAEMEIKHNYQSFQEKEGLIFIENAQSGDYQLNVKGKFPGGKYTVLVGQISETDDKWFEIQGDINSLLPFLQTDSYEINFNPTNLLDFPVNQNDINSLFDLLLKKLELLKQGFENSNLKQATEELKVAKKNYNQQNYRQMRTGLFKVHSELFAVRKKDKVILKNETLTVLNQLENLYERTSDISGYSPKTKELEQKLENLTKEYSRLESGLLKEKERGDDDFDEAVSLSQMQEKLQKAGDELAKNNLPLVEILLLSADKLGKEAK